MLVGPVFGRELVTAPRRFRFYAAPAAYLFALFLLMCTGWQILAGTQVVRNIGDLARFGSAVFQILAPLHLTVVSFLAAMNAASAVSLEKDRRTLELLLLTRLTNSELVLGKLFASILGVLMLVAATAPPLAIWTLFGGVSFEQVVRVVAVTLGSSLAAASLGSTLALWREKTFQTLAMTALSIVLWTAGWHIVSLGLLGKQLGPLDCEAFAAGFSPWHALEFALRIDAPVATGLGPLGNPLVLFLVIGALLTVALNGVAIWRVRIWNPTREVRRAAAFDPAEEWGARETTPEEDDAARARAHAAPGRLRPVWNNPILWREVRTWAYGRRQTMLRLAYLAAFALAAASVYSLTGKVQVPSMWEAAKALGPLAVLSLLLINAQAVTSLTSERDIKALDLLLATDLTPVEFVCGKLAGVFYNTKEMAILPMLLAGYLWRHQAIDLEGLAYLYISWLVLICFSAMLGLHSGMNYVQSRTAIGMSLGTLFFLAVGIAVCMRIMLAFRGSFEGQLPAFTFTMIGGGAGLYWSLGNRRDSMAIAVAAFASPFATFYVLTSLLLEFKVAPFLGIVATYGFATAALLVPAIFEFDVATGRTTGGDD